MAVARTKAALQDFFKSRGINWWHTPPESPDANPIENLWHGVKGTLVHVHVHTCMLLNIHVGEIVVSVHDHSNKAAQSRHIRDLNP